MRAHHRSLDLEMGKAGDVLMLTAVGFVVFLERHQYLCVMMIASVMTTWSGTCCCVEILFPPQPSFDSIVWFFVDGRQNLPHHTGPVSAYGVP